MPGEVPELFGDTTPGKVELWTPFVPYQTATAATVWTESERGSAGGAPSDD